MKLFPKHESGTTECRSRRLIKDADRHLIGLHVYDAEDCLKRLAAGNDEDDVIPPENLGELCVTGELEKIG